MRQDIVKVDWLLFPEDARAVEKHICAYPGIERMSVNPVDGLSVVIYDESRVTIDDIKRLVAECGYHCRGVVNPRYLTKKEDEATSEEPSELFEQDGGDIHA